MITMDWSSSTCILAVIVKSIKAESLWNIQNVSKLVTETLDLLRSINLNLSKQCFVLIYTEQNCDQGQFQSTDRICCFTDRI